MIQDAQFSSVQERWSEISDFFYYSVSDWGRVRNEKRDCLITPTRNSSGVMIVGLMLQGTQYKRSLPLLVARAFLPPPMQPDGKIRAAFDTPINLDGDRENNYVVNLMWRPLWYARKYFKQFSDVHATIANPIEDMETGDLYKNSMHAATTHGLLDFMIYLAMKNNSYVWPTGQYFREVV